MGAANRNAMAWWWLSVALGFALATGDLLTSAWPDFIQVLAIAPFVASAACSWRQVAASGAIMLSLTAGVEYAHGSSVAPLESAVRLLGVALGATLATLLAARRARLERRLIAARAAAEAAAQAKSRFMATLSHEMRTPLGAVIGMTSLLVDTPLEREQREYVEVIDSSSNALLALIHDVLEFSKIESDHVEIERSPFAVRACVEEALDLVASKAAEKGLDLGYVTSAAVPERVLGDAGRLRQVLVNLVGNAVKFTPRGHVRVELDARPLEGDEQLLSLAVFDTGIGIPRERREELFRPFHQLDTARPYGGTGLGLAISRRLCERMGGELFVDDGADQGSVFRCSVRVTRIATPAPREAPDLRGRRALVCEQGEVTRRMLREQLEHWGLAVSDAPAPEQALAWLRDGERFHCALVGVGRGQQLEWLSKLRELRTPEELPLIVLSPLTAREVVAQAARLGIAARLVTPLKPAQLRAAVLGLLAPPSARAPAAGGRAPIAAHGAPLRVLVAEDNTLSQKVAQQLLARLGHAADVVANGREALDALARRPYDVVLLDVHMPELDGLETARLIRRRFPLDGGPRLIAMTASVLKGDREACLAAGMDDYLGKPVRPADLAAALERQTSTSTTTTTTTTTVTRPEAPAPPATPPAAAPVFDGQALERLAALGEPGFVREIVQVFLAEAPARLEAARGALERGDLSALERLAHSLKSSAATLGGLRLASTCEALERVARQRDAAASGPLLARLCEDVAALEPCLRAHV